MQLEVKAQKLQDRGATVPLKSLFNKKEQTSPRLQQQLDQNADDLCNFRHKQFLSQQIRRNLRPSKEQCSQTRGALHMMETLETSNENQFSRPSSSGSSKPSSVRGIKRKVQQSSRPQSPQTQMCKSAVPFATARSPSPTQRKGSIQPEGHVLASASLSIQQMLGTLQVPFAQEVGRAVKNESKVPIHSAEALSTRATPALSSSNSPRMQKGPLPRALQIQGLQPHQQKQLSPLNKFTKEPDKIQQLSKSPQSVVKVYRSRLFESTTLGKRFATPSPLQKTKSPSAKSDYQTVFQASLSPYGSPTSAFNSKKAGEKENTSTEKYLKLVQQMEGNAQVFDSTYLDALGAAREQQQNAHYYSPKSQISVHFRRMRQHKKHLNNEVDNLVQV